jgi:hypothetical protein
MHFQAADKDYVQQGAWPEFSRFVLYEQLTFLNEYLISHPYVRAEYTVVFKDKPGKLDIPKIQEFLHLVEKLGLVGELVRSPTKPGCISLHLRADSRWYDETATKLGLLYELKPIPCRIPPEADVIVKKQVARESNFAIPIIEKMFEPFDQKSKELYLFNGYHNMYTGFRAAMIEYMLKERSDEGGCDLAKFVKSGAIANYFACHELSQVEWFKQNWILSLPWHGDPLNQIRNYFGEKIAFYFAWLSHLNKWLVAPSILGVIVTIYMSTLTTEQTNRSIVGPSFGLFMMIYFTLYFEFWKRRQNELAFEWGVIDFSKKEPDRPEFEADEEVFNFYSQQVELVYSPRKRAFKQMLTLPTVLMSIFISVFTVVIILMWRYVTGFLGPESQVDPYGVWKAVVPSLVNSVAIVMLGAIHKKLVTFLNDWENHQTQSDYESNLVSKVFLFEFMVNFTGLFYVAFVIRDMYQLYFAVLVQLVVIQVFTTVPAYLLPQFGIWLNRRKIKLSWSDVHASGDHYDTFDDFCEVAIQIGYISFFSAAFPAAAAFCLLSNVVEIRMDAYTILLHQPRPTPSRSSGIGVWQDIMETMNFIAIAFNAILIAITSNCLGASTYNFCRSRFESKSVDTSVNPNLELRNAFDYFDHQCIAFCASVYSSQPFPNTNIVMAPCGSVPQQKKARVAVAPSFNVQTGAPIDVDCSPSNPCKVTEKQDPGTPFLCNPVPLRAPHISNSSQWDYSRMYCLEGPYVNLVSGAWDFPFKSSVYIWNPFLNPVPDTTKQQLVADAFVKVDIVSYGNMACYLKCGSFSSLKAIGVVDIKGSPVCPYSIQNPLFNPSIRSNNPRFPTDYLSPSVLKIIQSAPSCTGNLPSSSQPLCFECNPQETKQLSTDSFFEVNFNSVTGPGLLAVIMVFIVEHVVFCIKVPFMTFVQSSL